jgi:penicillin-binding protein 2
VAMDPRTGEILGMASRPVFDPNSFAVRISSDEWRRLVTDQAAPLRNKAIQAQLAPGSVFKIIMAIAGLEERIAQDLVVNCGGGKNFYGRFFKCWVVAEKRVHGTVDLNKGIYQSCDVYFYTLAERLGIGRIARYALAFGIGKKTGVDLPDEGAGVMPSEEWKLKRFRQKWYAGETISVGIGQGAVMTTPIQLARAIGGIATGGRLRRPYVAFSDQFPAEYRQIIASAGAEERVSIDARHWESVTDSMVSVVQAWGTAPSARLEGIDFAGKTGSAQVVSNEARKKLTGKQYDDNAWFVGVAPRRNPEIVVAALIEQGEHGYLAGRLAAKVIKAYVDKQRRVRGIQVAQPPEIKRPVEVGAVWNQRDPHRARETYRGGRFLIPASGSESRHKPEERNDHLARAGARPRGLRLAEARR